mgnify:CR=1 FL=1
MLYTDQYYTDEQLLRATALSYLVCMYIKEYSGKLSAFCGCAIAAGTGMACALAWLKGAGAETMEKVINNMASSITGMICDGGNQGCTMKGIVAVDAAFDSVELAMDDVYILQCPWYQRCNSGRDHAQYGTDCVTWYDRNREDHCGYS